jgi:hypothetical protein
LRSDGEEKILKNKNEIKNWALKKASRVCVDSAEERERGGESRLMTRPSIAAMI